MLMLVGLFHPVKIAIAPHPFQESTQSAWLLVEVKCSGVPGDDNVLDLDYCGIETEACSC